VTDWGGVLAHDFAVPAGLPLAELADELVAMLAAADPAIRDDIAYPVLAIWTSRGVLDGQLAGLGDRLAERMGTGPIYQCTFAAMSLSWVILRDATTAELSDEQVLRWLDTFGAWWACETDLRGWDADLGWLHAIAHGADLLRAFGRSPRLDDQRLCGCSGSPSIVSWLSTPICGQTARTTGSATRWPPCSPGPSSRQRTRRAG
jgi:Protein of unknown function (DUF2785)